MYFIQIGKAGEPMQTVSVEHKDAPMRHHKMGLCYTATGYGAKIPTTIMVKYNGVWRRVYCRIYSNSGTCYVMIAGERCTVVES